MELTTSGDLRESEYLNCAYGFLRAAGILLEQTMQVLDQANIPHTGDLIFRLEDMHADLAKEIEHLKGLLKE